MKSDARFIQDIKHIYQLGAYLCSQTDSLRFAAREGFGASAEAEVFQTDIQ